MTERGEGQTQDTISTPPDSREHDRVVASLATLEKRGDQLGPFKLIETLGEGGFGTVWLAERREPMVQRVALKIIKPGMDSRAVIARFEQERQALAVMDHPNVAKVFDGGVTPTGRPYFVMEYVQGEPITDFCDRHRYTIKQRLELFISVCDAVQHAHHKGIIHRDIKPTNILVSLKDQSAIAKVIDFGVAKAISHTLTEKTIFTEHGQLIGTPEYMSPEQAEMGALDIDTRTDVYSLGVVLYELLSGVLPFDSAMLRVAGYHEIQRIIREVEPPRPSTKLSTVDHGKAATIAKARQEDRKRIVRALRRELEWIPLCAIRKERVRRYPSAQTMGRDIKRFLAGEPLEAAPESLVYRFGKRFRRQRRQIILVVAALVVLLGPGRGAEMIALGWMWASVRVRATLGSRASEHTPTGEVYKIKSFEFALRYGAGAERFDWRPREGWLQGLDFLPSERTTELPSDIVREIVRRIVESARTRQQAGFPFASESPMPFVVHLATRAGVLVAANTNELPVSLDLVSDFQKGPWVFDATGVRSVTRCVIDAFTDLGVRGVLVSPEFGNSSHLTPDQGAHCRLVIELSGPEVLAQLVEVLATDSEREQWQPAGGANIRPNR